MDRYGLQAPPSTRALEPYREAGFRFRETDEEEVSRSLRDPPEVVLVLDAQDLALEGSIGSPPKAHSQGCISPSDLDLHRLQLDRRVAAVQDRVAQEAGVPLAQGRLALLGLTLVASVRALAWWQGTVPGYTTFSMHFLTTTSDLACLICALPLFAAGTQGQCVLTGLLGPMLTLVFAMSTLDTCALGAYLVVATPRPLQSEKPFFEELEASLGVWEFTLLASVALQMSLCAATWRVYKELRMTGLYPPGSDPTAVGRMREVPFMEVMCETEDVDAISECFSPQGAALEYCLPRGDRHLPLGVAKAGLAEGWEPITPSTAAADPESRWSLPSLSEAPSPAAPAWRTPGHSPAAAAAQAEVHFGTPERPALHAGAPRGGARRAEEPPRRPEAAWQRAHLAAPHVREDSRGSRASPLLGGRPSPAPACPEASAEAAAPFVLRENTF